MFTNRKLLQGSFASDFFQQTLPLMLQYVTSDDELNLLTCLETLREDLIRQRLYAPYSTVQELEVVLVKCA